MLPVIAPYEPPAGFTRSTGRVGWRIEPQRAVLLVHDMQNYFLGAFGGPGHPALSRAIAAIADLRAHAARAGIPVIYTAQPGGQTRAERGLLRDFWGDGPPADPQALAIVDALRPGPDDVVVTKRRYSAFVDSPFAGLLGDRDQLVVTGVYAHIGVLATALDAFMRGVQPFVVADGVADFGPDEHAATLRHVAQSFGVALPAAEVTADLLQRT